MIKCPNCGLELRPDSSNPQRMKCTNCDYALDATTDDHADMLGFTYTPAALHEDTFETAPASNDVAERSSSAYSEAAPSSAYDEEPAFKQETHVREQPAKQSQPAQVTQQAARAAQQPAQVTQQAAQPTQPERASSSSMRTAQAQAQFTQHPPQQETAPQQATQQAAQSQAHAAQHAAQRSAQQQFADQYWGTQGVSQAAYQARQAEAAAAARMRAQQFAAYWGVPPHAGGAYFAGNQPGAAMPQGMYGGMPGCGASSQAQATSDATAASNAASPSAPPKKSASGLAIASLVLGILALLFCWVPVVSFSGLVLGIVGIVLGTVALARINRTTTEGKGLATAGSICSAIALILALLMSIVSVFLVNAVVKDSNLYDSVVRNFITVQNDASSTHLALDGYLVDFDFGSNA